MLWVTRLTFEKIIFLLYHVITRLGKEGISMEQDRIRIVDVADALGLSTATVSKVIHGKTEKISDETIKRVQQELERSGYIPNMAGILLARNNSRIIGVVVNDHEKYEGRVLEDGFVMSSLNDLSREVNEKGYFLMIKTTADISEIPVFASMWNMDGLILMGFCEADYNDSAQKTPAVRKNVRRMNAPITNNATIIQTGFSSGIVGFSWPDVLQNAVIRYIVFTVSRETLPVVAIK